MAAENFALMHLKKLCELVLSKESVTLGYEHEIS